MCKPGPWKCPSCGMKHPGHLDSVEKCSWCHRPNELYVKTELPLWVQELVKKEFLERWFH